MKENTIMNRELQKDLVYLNIAEQIGSLSFCERKKVGCIIVKNDNIISTGFNGTPSNMDNCCEDINGDTKWFVLHSESNAILKLAKSTLSSEGATMYITLSPCKECAKLILQSGIKKIIYNRNHSCQEGINFLHAQGIKCIFIDKENNKLTSDDTIIDNTSIGLNIGKSLNKNKIIKIENKNLKTQLNKENNNFQINDNDINFILNLLNNHSYNILHSINISYDYIQNLIINETFSNQINNLNLLTEFNHDEKLLILILDWFDYLEFNDTNEFEQLLSKLKSTNNFNNIFVILYNNFKYIFVKYLEHELTNYSNYEFKVFDDNKLYLRNSPYSSWTLF